MYSLLKDRLLEARKIKDTFPISILTSLIDDIDKKVFVARKKAEASGSEYSIPDSEVIAVLKNNQKNMLKSQEDIIAKVGECDEALYYAISAKFIEELLPPKVEGDDLRQVITELGAANMGQAMKLLKEASVAGQFDYDGREASLIAKEVFL